METREAVIAIQGGGVYGLSLLGQLSAVFEHGYLPMAFAGTSAGAIIATLSWAGFKPDEIVEKFAALAQDEERGRLTFLLGGEEDSFDFDRFCLLKTDVFGMMKQLSHISSLGWLEKMSFGKRAAKLFSQYLIPHYRKRGFFSGDYLEQKLDHWIREKLDIPGVPDGEPITFKNVMDWMITDPDRNYRPPLLITATNLSRKRVEVISSIDKNYEHLSIAKAVRASAGFPVFFSPVDLRYGPGEGGWFVDGGVVANFPMWAFSDAFRSKIRQSAFSDVYCDIADRPWMRIGLRVVEGPKSKEKVESPKAFLGSLLSMLTGGTRNELERILTDDASRSIVIEQPLSETAGPLSVLDVGGLDEKRILAMVAKGKEFSSNALNKIKSPGLFVEKERVFDSINSELDSLIKRCECLFGDEGKRFGFRSNVFMPVLHGEVLKMDMVFGANMDTDDDWGLSFDNLSSGLTGYCFTNRRPQICNLEEIAKSRAKSHSKDLFGMDKKLQERVSKKQTWLVSIPIFDPVEMRFKKKLNSNRLPEGGRSLPPAKHHASIETEIDGPVIGVLNLDVGWKYAEVNLSKDVDDHCEDHRIQAILALAQSTTFRLGSMLVQQY